MQSPVGYPEATEPYSQRMPSPRSNLRGPIESREHEPSRISRHRSRNSRPRALECKRRDARSAIARNLGSRWWEKARDNARRPSASACTYTRRRPCRHLRRKLTCQRLRHRAKVKTALTRGYEIAYTEVAAPREGTGGFARVGDQLLMRPKPGKPLRKPCTSYVF